MEKLNRRDRLIKNLTAMVRSVLAAGGRADEIVMNPSDAGILEMDTLEGVPISPEPSAKPGVAYIMGDGWDHPATPAADA